MKKIVSLILALCMLFSATAAFAEEKPVYVALGDSITTGYGLMEGEKGFTEIVAEANGYALINYAVDGNTASGILTQMSNPAMLMDIAKADVITVTCGGNDLMGILYQQMAEIFNANIPEAMAAMRVKPEEITTIMANPADSRQQMLLLAAKTVLEGNPELGITPFVQSDAIKNGITSYLTNMGIVMATIRKVNPDVSIIVTTQYNPYGHFDGIYASLNQGMNMGAMALSKYITDYAPVLGYQVADVYSAFSGSSENLMNAAMEPLNLDFHPNAAGHAVIAKCVNAVLNPAEATVDKMALLKDAVIYTLPMMMVKATEIKVTNTETASWTQAPINQLVKVPVLADASAKDVVTPNVDTIYTQAMIDLLKDAVVLKLPKTDRFSIMQFMDAYTSTITIIDCMTFENDEETFLLTGPFWQGEVPEGMTEIKCPSNMVWMLGRTICSDFEDSASVRAIQAQMDMYTLSAHLNGTYADKPKGEFVEAENFIPRNFVLSRTMEEYFDIANQLMLANPPADADKEHVAKFAAINVGPGLDFDPSIFGTEEEIAAAWAQNTQAVFVQVAMDAAPFAVKNGPWKMSGDPLGVWNTEYGYRAAVSLVALGANPIEMAVYPNTSTDSEGKALSGENKYVIHIDADAFPPTHENGFWSITAYNEVNYLIDNEIDRYAIKNNTPYILNEDGSLDIYVQAEKPADEKMLANWLPVSESAFQLYLRVYLPKDCVLNNEWVMPSITKVTAE
ncbi:MAG: DUF1254 domain-containing protein [Clostridia bacterium]|nr:DUF1254 domain-containing protein [Clostridia bacterium]